MNVRSQFGDFLAEAVSILLTHKVRLIEMLYCGVFHGELSFSIYYNIIQHYDRANYIIMLYIN